jgi:polynucleotide 5'-hydroxyl-kinase GRC3/NOL9
MEIIAPQEWYAPLDALDKERGVAILIGATDTGKSTLAKILITNLCKRGLKVAPVDADIGQSILGPPAFVLSF